MPWGRPGEAVVSGWRGILLVVAGPMVLGAGTGWWASYGSLKVKQPPPAVALAQEGAPGAALELREARLMAAHLAEQNSALRLQLAENQRRLQIAGEELAACRLADDRAAVAQAGQAVPRRPAENLAQAVAVVDAARDLGMVILNQGAQGGMRAGMRFRVMRADREVARVRVLDVRNAIAGAMVEETTVAEYPQAGDRAIPARDAGH